MAKKKRPVIKRAPTAGERAKWQKEKQRNRVVMIFGIIIVAAVLSLLGYGYYDKVYQPDRDESNKLHKTIIQVDQKKFNLEYVIDIMHYRKTLPQSSSSGVDSSASYTINDITQLVAYHELLIQAAPGLDISVSDEEVETTLKSVTVPEGAPIDLTEEQYAKYYKDYLKFYDISDEQFRWWVTGSLLSTDLLEQLKTQVPESAEQVRLQGVLIAQDKVPVVSDRLVFTSDGLSQIAQEVSLDYSSKDNEGMMGWLAGGIMSDAFDEIAFNLEPGVLSQPIVDETGQTAGGVWMLSALEKDPERALDETQVESIASVSYAKWFEQQYQEGTESNKVINNLDDSIREWARNYYDEHFET